MKQSAAEGGETGAPLAVTLAAIAERGDDIALAPAPAMSVAGWGGAMAEPDRISVRLRRVEETIDLLRATLPGEQEAVTERIGAVESALDKLKTDVSANGYRERQDWDLLAGAVRRAEALKTMEEDAGARLDRIEQRQGALTGEIAALHRSCQLWGGALFLTLAVGLLAVAQ